LRLEWRVMNGYARTRDAVEAARRGPAAAWLAIVLLLLSFVLVRQLCDPWSAAPAHSEPASACCASLAGDALAKRGEPIAARLAAGGGAPIAPIAALAAAGPAFLALPRIAPPGAFLPEPSYYARSARIRR
jgi:cobalamin synthase